MKYNFRIIFALFLFVIITSILFINFDKEIAASSYSVKKMKWCNYMFTPDSESEHDTDLDVSTGKVNNSTNLTDGVYIPDKFSWSGGTGRVSISCSKITVINGQVYATIIFSSPNYSYVKTNGNVYYPIHSENASRFTIPVELNVNNQILGMTTAMSSPHEIAYDIFVYCTDTEKTGEKVPQIMGLEFQEEIKVKDEKHIKIYRYENDIFLLEVDMEENLYKQDIVKYLIVPEDTEIPAGLDKEMIVIRKPINKIYVEDYDNLDYKKLIKEKYNLVILKDDLLNEKEEKLFEITDKLTLLDIPVMIERFEEKEEVYNILFESEEK